MAVLGGRGEGGRGGLRVKGGVVLGVTTVQQVELLVSCHY